MAENIGHGLLFWVILSYLILYGSLKKIGSVISIADPISIYLFFRLSPAIVVLCFSIFYIWDTHSDAILIYAANILLSAIPLLLIRYRKLEVHINEAYDIFYFTLFLCLIKILIIMPAFTEMPIFTGGGSDGIIKYYESNKIAGVFILGIGNIDLILLSFLRRCQFRGIVRMTIYISIVILLIFIISSLKKGAILNAVFAIIFGEALAYRYIRHPKPVIFTVNKIILALVISVTWAFYIALESNVRLENMNILHLFDVAIYQFMVPYFTYFKSDFWSFASSYEFDKILFYFHTITSPLGAPAFDASIGPSYHGYLTGRITGNGINPTFILEGLIFWGTFGALTTLLYIFVSVCFLSIVRLRIRPSQVLVFTVIIVVLFPVLWIDSLLFMKRVIAITIVLLSYLSLKLFLRRKC